MTHITNEKENCMKSIMVRNSSGELTTVKDKVAFMQAYSMPQINSRLRNCKNVKDVIKADQNSIVLCRKQLNDDVVIDTIDAMILHLLGTINVHQTLTSEQIDELIEIIIVDYYFISITELAYIFRQAIKGKLGKVDTFALNIHTVVSWLNEYQEQRISEFMTANQRNHDLTKSGKEIFTDENGETKIRDRQTNIIPEFIPHLKKMSEGMPKPKRSTKDYDPNAGQQIYEPEQNEELKRQKEELKKRYPDEKWD